MKKLFSKFNKNQFRILATIMGLAGDVVLCVYTYISFSSSRAQFQEAFKLAQKLNPKAGMPDEFIDQLFPMMVQSLTVMLVGYLLAHSIVYLCFYLNKRFAILYVRFISWIAIFGAFLVGVGAFSKDYTLFGIYFFIQSFIFLFMALGIKHYGMLKIELPNSEQEDPVPTP